MTRTQQVTVLALRLALGGMFLYSGITKIIDPSWSAAGYLNGAKTFAEFYHLLTTPTLLPLVNTLNAWGQALLGVALLVGIAVRTASLFGMLLMLLYYFPILSFPYPNPHAFLVDEHIIYITALGVLASFSGTEPMNLGRWCARIPLCAKIRWLNRILI